MNSFTLISKIYSKQAPESRLTWPALLEHPFVKETNNEIEARVGILNFNPDNSALGKDAHWNRNTIEYSQLISLVKYGSNYFRNGMR